MCTVHNLVPCNHHVGHTFLFFLPEFDKVRDLNVLAVHFFVFVADLLSGDISTSSGTSTGCKTHFQLQNACHNMIALGLCCFLPFVCFNSFSFLMGSACLFDIIITYSCNGYEVGLTSITFVIFYFFFVLLERSEVAFDVFGQDQQ